MQMMQLNDKYPVYRLEVAKSETRFESCQELVDYFIQLIDNHDIARFIAEFDHYSHTSGLIMGEIASDILDARNIIFCFGTKLPFGEMLALRPRSIGIAETDHSFILSFMEAPMEAANQTVKSWVASVSTRKLA